MTKREAIELLRHHSFTHEDYTHQKSKNGFLGMLRPFQGELNEANFHELFVILKLLKNEFYKDHIEREYISTLWGICYLSKCWAIDEEGMLRSNNLISKKQIELLATWLDCLNYAIMCLLEGAVEEAFAPYEQYLEEQNNIR